MNALRFDPFAEKAMAMDYMAARDASRARFAALAAAAGGPEAARDILRSRTQVRRARERAAHIGLAYWPALIRDGYQPNIDPRAYVAAERHLRARHGIYDHAAGTHGGWDSKGHHGLSRSDVAAMWFAAGCRDSRKFALQVRTGVTARKGDSAPFAANYARGYRWALAWGVEWKLSRKALAALGRLSPELRHAAVRGLPDELKGGRDDLPRWKTVPFRIADLNWAEVARVQALRFDPSPRAHALRAIALPPRPAAVILGRDHRRKMPHPISDAAVVDLCPSYPTVRLEIARRIVSGESPASISGGALTRKEAHAWLSAGGPESERDIPASVIRWIVRDCPLDGHTPRDLTVARWLAHVHQRGAWSALTKTERHPDGRAVRRLDVVDEITAADLDQGVKTGVIRAFENAGERMAKVDEGDTTVICHNPFGRLPRPLAVLTTPAALAAEGRALQHCVGGYSEGVRQGQCLILSVASWHGRSTVELRPGAQWAVAQHRGVKNAEPHRRHHALVSAWLNRINRRVNRRAA